MAEDEQLGNVLVYAPWGCGECRFCRATEEMICPDGREAGLFQDGGYAEYVRVPARRYLYPIGDLDPVQAAPLGCGGLTPYRVRQARARRGSVPTRARSCSAPAGSVSSASSSCG